MSLSNFEVNEKKVVCHECKGRYMIDSIRIMKPGGPQIHAKTKCPVCNGDGWYYVKQLVKKPVFTKMSFFMKLKNWIFNNTISNYMMGPILLVLTIIELIKDKFKKLIIRLLKSHQEPRIIKGDE